MKTPHDPRHQKRQKVVQDLFSMSFHRQPVGLVAKDIIAHRDTIDRFISRSAVEYPIEKINKIDLAILRLAVYELIIEKKEPTNVIIDEAVELAKEYGGETTPGFVNGTLSSIIAYEKPTKISQQ